MYVKVIVYMKTSSNYFRFVIYNKYNIYKLILLRSFIVNIYYRFICILFCAWIHSQNEPLTTNLRVVFFGSSF